ncbi:T9SS type A sorting domain-containing protein [Luteibaculum oceani]|uniref:T9SS type A sorting domain-containing protein n=1 Tax=Luteibaculum oceani TaxID=1294296 RepID=A0A5C6VAR9_9FLAO|nr:T9SS type A sorting domain-containing protein [Luteibaculum oceani]TXC81950.1 T9SS type A sorting domain-containing protein [Luteibaculum oceani]
MIFSKLNLAYPQRHLKRFRVIFGGDIKFILCLVVLVFTTNQAVNAQLNCSGAAELALNQTYSGTTVGGNSNVSTYNNDPWWQLTGPEKVHELNWPGGNVLISLTNKSAGLDLILLNACDNNDFAYSGGGNSGTADSYINAYLDQGLYYVIVDGWQGASGTYDLFVQQKIPVNINGVTRTFVLNNGTLYEEVGQQLIPIESNVISVEKDWGYVTNVSTGEGVDANVLSIMKQGEEKPRMFLNENFNTQYLKQKLDCQQFPIFLYGDKVYYQDVQTLDNCDVLRCENGNALVHTREGKIKLHTPAGQEKWVDVDQIITVAGISYIIKSSDKSVWELTRPGSQSRQISNSAVLLQDNDNQLIKIDAEGKYSRWNGENWKSITPLFTGVSPEASDEGFWCFWQPKTLLESSNVQLDHIKGLKVSSTGEITVGIIPKTGNCEEFLWRVVDAGNGKKYIFNKAKGDTMLALSNQNTLIFSKTEGKKLWDVQVSNKEVYGTNGYQVIGDNGNKALEYVFGVALGDFVQSGSTQTWLFQFNQMVRDYFLPVPTRSNLETHYTDNPNFNLSTDASEIESAYNKFLKASNGVTIFSTNTCSDWVTVNYYLTVDNMMNAVKKPKPADPKVNPSLINELDVMAGQSLVIIGKNDLNYSVPNYYFTKGFNSFSVASLRGSAGYLAPRRWILVSEELTCKTGIVNRPMDTGFRRFDHGVHEFGHALQELCNWIAIVDANDMCNDERNASSECFCYDMQNWFNSNGNSNLYPGLRASKWWTPQSQGVSAEQRAEVMKRIFEEENTWMPPKVLRQNGYTPSGPTKESTSVGVLNVVKYSLKVFPNPAEDFLTIDVAQANDLKVTLIDFGGKQVFESDLNQGINNIPCKNWDSGVYMLLINGPRGTQVKKVVIK